MGSTQIIILCIIVAYLAMMVVIGVIYSKKTDNVGDFYLGGRTLGPIVTAMSAEASDMSSYLIMGLPGLAYFSGCSEVGWTIIGLFIGTYLNWLIVAKRLRIYSQKTGSITIPDFFSDRYRDKSHVLMGISAIIIIIFFIPYTGSGFAACGKLFTTLFGLDYHIAMIVSAVVIVAYTCLGGFLAASTTDLIQSIVMTLALAVLVLYGVAHAGGVDAVIENAKSMQGYLSLTHGYDETTGNATAFGFIPIVSTLAWGLGYFGMPHILLRFMAIRDKNEIKVSRRIASIWVIISMFVAMMIGIIGRQLSAEGFLRVFEGNADAETLVVEMANKMSTHGVFLILMAGLIFSGILACTMSTSDSQLLAASSAMSENLIGGLFGIKLSEKQKMVWARIIVLLIAVLGIIIAWDPNSSVFRVVSFAWAGFGATFGPVMLTALFWKRSNKYGAIAGMTAGAVMIFVWKFVIRGLSPVLNIYELLPAFLVALVVIIVVSLCTAEPEKEITEEFDSVAAELKSAS
ncbi:MAG: sodium/proline symporter [Oscillospiraceae bacterium]|nr:sodium/proline symporter [Oscillospiraceae bacterium]